MPDEMTDNIIANYLIKLEKILDYEQFHLIDLKESIAKYDIHIKEFVPIYASVAK